MPTRNARRTLLAVLALVALTVVAAGCGGSATSPSSAAGNRTDAAFVTDMTSHHQGAIDVARLAGTRAEHAEVKAMAGDIIAAQQGEIATMRKLMDDMHAKGMQGAGHMGMSAHEMGMDMDALDGARPFDKAVIDAMVPHHQGAIAMARAELANGTQPGLRAMARNIINAQTDEIAQMRRWRNAWYGSANGSGEMRGHGSDGSMDMG